MSSFAAAAAVDVDVDVVVDVDEDELNELKELDELEELEGESRLKELCELARVADLLLKLWVVSSKELRAFSEKILVYSHILFCSSEAADLMPLSPNDARERELGLELLLLDSCTLFDSESLTTEPLWLIFRKNQILTLAEFFLKNVGKGKVVLSPN